MHEQPKKIKIAMDIPKACERCRAKLSEAALIAATALKKDEEAIAEGKPGNWNFLSAGIAYLRHLMRPKPDTLAWHTEIDYYLERDPRLRYVSETPNVYKTPPEVVDFVTANPPMGDLPPGADGVEPRDEPISPDAPPMARGPRLYRRKEFEVFNLGGIDFIRHEGDGERIVYIGIPLQGHYPLPTVTVMTLIRRAPGGWMALAYNTKDEKTMHLVFPDAGRDSAERAARGALAGIIAHNLHKAKRNARWRANKRARLAEQDANGEAVEPLSPEEELADTVARQKEDA